MRVYLDTSSIRKNSNSLNMFKSHNTFTSALVVFELISGINEKDFFLRQKVIKNLLDSSIYIDWDTYQKKMHNSFSVSFNDSESDVIRQMVTKIVACKTFDEYTQLKIVTEDGTYYTYESFVDFDEEISKIGKKYSQIARDEWKNKDKEDRKMFIKHMFEEKYIKSYVQFLSEISMMVLVEDLSEHKRPSPEYFDMLDKYDGESLDVYLKYNNLLYLLHEINGSECSKNDTIDSLHLLYLKRNDTIVSEDKIFKKLCEHIQLIKANNSEEIMSISNGKSTEATYEQIRDFIKNKYGISVKPCWIAHMKELCGLKVRVAHNRIDKTKRKYPCPEAKRPMIEEAFKHFGML